MKRFFIILLLLIVVGVGGSLFLLSRRGSGETSKAYQGFNFVVEGDKIKKGEFDKIDGQYYLSLDFIKEYIDDSVKYDENEKTIIFVNEQGTKRIKVGAKEGVLNSQKIGLRDPIIEKDSKIYIPIEAFVYDYPITLKFIENKNLLIMDYKDVEYAVGISPGNGLNMRESDSTKSPIVSILKKDDKVYVYGEEGDFYKVREVEGYAGYISKSKLEVKFPKNRFKIEKEKKKREAKAPLNLTWDYTYARQSDDIVSGIKELPGVDVVCPTWFSVADSSGNIIDRGRQDYVKKYNDLGIDVWGYLDNSFKADLTTEFLSKSSSREKAIEKVLSLTKQYGLKGINIDFENTKIDDRDGITQFVRELAGVFHSQDLIVSIDVTPQISSNVKKEPYDRRELGKIADYVMLMAYDQHWSTSDKAGSVAEYNWVEGNINLVINQIPQEKLILCVPFYSRLWSEDDKSLKSDALSMGQVNKILQEKNAKIDWDIKAKQDYAEYTSNSKHYKIWVENSESIKWKTSLVGKYGLGGVASWRKGFETGDIWQTIKNVLSDVQNV